MRRRALRAPRPLAKLCELIGVELASPRSAGESRDERLAGEEDAADFAGRGRLVEYASEHRSRIASPAELEQRARITHPGVLRLIDDVDRLRIGQRALP